MKIKYFVLRILRCFLILFFCSLQQVYICKAEVKSNIEKFELKERYQIAVQSQQYQVGNCVIWITANFEFDWDGIPSHQPTNISVTNTQLHIACSNNEPPMYYIRYVNAEVNEAEGYIYEIKIEDTEEDEMSNTMLNDTDFMNNFKNQINDAIHEFTS